MCAIVVVVTDVFGEQPLQMPFVYRNDVIEQVATAAFHPSFGHAILPRTFKRGSYGLDLQRSDRCGNLDPIPPIPVKDQKSGSQRKRERFPQLLNGPQARWMLGHVEVQDAPTIMSDHEETVDQTESDRWDREEIHRGNGFPMVAEKGQPTLAWFTISGRSFHPAGYRSLRDIKTQHEELAMDARRSPSPILGHHSEDQFANLFRSLSSPDLPPDLRDRPPIHLKTSPVPADHRLGRDHDERLFPLRPKSTDGNPEKLVENAEPWPRTAPLQHDELLPKHEILEEETPVATKNAEEHSEPEEEKVEHGLEL